MPALRTRARTWLLTAWLTATALSTLPEDADKSAEYVLEFTTESGDTQSFDTLSYEVAPISLLSVDAAAGATPISFTAPEQ